MTATDLERGSLVEKKIKRLLNNHDLKDDERNLVALALLAKTNMRLEGVMSADALDQENQQKQRAGPGSTSNLLSLHLFNFCIRLIRSNQESLMQLASTVVCLLERGCVYNWNGMTQALLAAIKHRSDGELCLDQIDVNLLRCLLHCVAVDNDIFLGASHFEVVWKRFKRCVDKPSYDNFESKVCLDPHRRFMEETLAGFHEASDESKKIPSEDAWKQPFIDLWHVIALRNPSVATLPLPWYESMVLTTVSSNWQIPLQTRMASHAMVFQATKTVAIFSSNFQLSNPSVAQGLVDLIMAHLGSSQSKLRLNVVELCSILVSGHGWGWIPSSERKLTQASHLCTWTRLAAGELRLQLEIACDGESSLFEAIALEASGLIIVAAMELLSQEAKNADDGLDLTLDPEALLHLRQSLYNAVQATVNYFEITVNPKQAPSKVLGLLLREFSIWDDDMPDGVTTESMLLAVRKAMCVGIVEMMPCLANLLASAAEDEDKEEHLRKAEVLADSLDTYFVKFWTDEAFTHKDAVSSACSAVESWFLLLDPTPMQTRSLAKHIILWIEATVSQPAIDSSAATPLMAAVGCYVVLMGDRLPPNGEAKTVEFVLSYYAKLNELA